MSQPVIVKFVAKGMTYLAADLWQRQLPSGSLQWGNCKFTFDPDARSYDWYVVYDDLPSIIKNNRRSRKRKEKLACPREHTLFITAEPSSVKIYGSRFLTQFGTILSSQEPWAIRHTHVINSQPALRWFYGVPNRGSREHMLDYDYLKSNAALKKDRDISTVCSSKRMSHTFHRTRYDFIQKLKSELPKLEIYGHGVRPMIDKAEALDRYRYHIVIENHICKHHWTEKLADAFLACTLPIYCGCPNIADYFPEKSFIQVDASDYKTTLAKIRQAIENHEYEKRLPSILEARELVLNTYNIFPVVEKIIRQQHNPHLFVRENQTISSRHAIHRNIFGGIHYLAEQFQLKQSRK